MTILKPDTALFQPHHTDLISDTLNTWQREIERSEDEAEIAQLYTAYRGWVLTAISLYTIPAEITEIITELMIHDVGCINSKEKYADYGDSARQWRNLKNRIRVLGA